MAGRVRCRLDGKSLRVCSMQITHGHGVCTVQTEVLCDGERYCLRFENVSSLKVVSAGRETIIDGFEIIDHAADSWQKDVRYEVGDFEGESVSMYCESYEIKPYGELFAGEIQI